MVTEYRKGRDFTELSSYRPRISETHAKLCSEFEQVLDEIKPILRQNINKDGKKKIPGILECRYLEAKERLCLYLDRYVGQMPKMQYKEIFWKWEETGKFKSGR
jgi:hypothetical protein